MPQQETNKSTALKFPFLSSLLNHAQWFKRLSKGHMLLTTLFVISSTTLACESAVAPPPGTRGKWGGSGKEEAR